MSMTPPMLVCALIVGPLAIDGSEWVDHGGGTKYESAR
jgi:hypothetical protein